MALGARPAALARDVAGHGLLLVAVGVVVGLFAAQLLFGRLLTQVLFETRTTDPVAAVAAAALLLAAAAIACTAPARRAATVAPLEGLKSDQERRRSAAVAVHCGAMTGFFVVPSSFALTLILSAPSFAQAPQPPAATPAPQSTPAPRPAPPARDPGTPGYVTAKESPARQRGSLRRRRRELRHRTNA